MNTLKEAERMYPNQRQPKYSRVRAVAARIAARNAIRAESLAGRSLPTDMPTHARHESLRRMDWRIEHMAERQKFGNRIRAYAQPKVHNHDRENARRVKQASR